MVKIKDSIETLGDLPSQPIILQKLHELISRQNTSSHNVAKVVETDQGFTAKVLRLVNSPFFGFTRTIASVEEAITMIGFNSVHQLLLATSLMGTFKIDKSVFDLDLFWQHCFSVGVIAKHIATHSFHHLKEESFVGGVLHDVGRLILINADIKRYQKYSRENSGAVDLETEKENFGVNHQEAGMMLAEYWHFPDSIRDGIGYHHTPDKIEANNELAAVIHISDIMTHGLNLGNSGNFYVSDFSSKAWMTLRISYDELGSILEKALAQIDETDHLIKDIA